MKTNRNIILSASISAALAFAGCALQTDGANTGGGGTAPQNGPDKAKVLMLADNVSLDDYNRNSVIIKMDRDADPSLIAGKINGTVQRSFVMKDFLYAVVSLAPGCTVKDALKTLGTAGGFITAEPNYIRRHCLVPNDPKYLPYQYSHRIANSEAGWDITTGSTNVILAIVDTGVDGAHPDLASNMIAGMNMLTGAAINPCDNSDDVGHGTHVAGISGGMGNNLLGICGVAWNCRIMPVKVLSASGGDDATIAQGIVWATDHKGTCRMVINMSLGGIYYSQLMADAVNYAMQNGVVVVVAMGNDSHAVINYPAAYPGIIAVGSSDGNDSISYFSTRGSHVSVVAPGSSIYSTYYDGGYACMSGTSMATPFVSGLCALMLSKDSNLTPSQVKTILEMTADDLGDPGFDTAYGYGRVNVGNALSAASGDKYGVLRVCVSNGDGVQVQDVNVLLFNSSNVMVKCAKTSTNGAYFYYVPYGDYTVRASYYSEHGSNSAAVNNANTLSNPAVAVISFTNSLSSMIGGAVECTNTVWSCGGDAVWAVDTVNFTNDGDSIRSGGISDGQSTYISTSFTGSGVSFCWKVSSEANYDYLRFYIDGVQQAAISGAVNWQTMSFATNYGAHTLTWQYSKDGSVSAGSDCGWVDCVRLYQLPAPAGLTTNECTSNSVSLVWNSVAGAAGYKIFRSPTINGAYIQIGASAAASYNDTGLTPATIYYYRVSATNAAEDGAQSGSFAANTAGFIDPIGEGVDNTGAAWVTGGCANWVLDTSVYLFGGDSVRSGTITDYQSNFISADFNGSGITFCWKVSSEANFDFLRFYIDGALYASISGTVDWQMKSFTLANGAHTAKWIYSKDGSVSIGSDCGWVDAVGFTNASDSVIPTVAIQNPTNGQTLLTGAVMVCGTAYDNYNLNAVWISVDSAPFTAVRSNINLTSAAWSNTVQLAAGAHTIRAYSADMAGNTSATDTIAVNATGGTAVFSDNFENGTNGWAATGYWHMVGASSAYSNYSSPFGSWWYGQDSNGTYDDGARNSGSLTSPVITVPAAGGILRFNYWTATEGSYSYDQCWVQISNNGGVFSNVAQMLPGTGGAWVSSGNIGLNGYAGSAIQVRFFFDTMDSVGNAYRGWYVDDVQVLTY